MLLEDPLLNLPLLKLFPILLLEVVCVEGFLLHHLSLLLQLLLIEFLCAKSLHVLLGFFFPLLLASELLFQTLNLFLLCLQLVVHALVDRHAVLIEELLVLGVV